MQLPLFPDHVDYSATPTGIIPAWWLLQSGTVKALRKKAKKIRTHFWLNLPFLIADKNADDLYHDLCLIPLDGAIRHKRFTIEYSYVSSKYHFFVIDRSHIIARFEAPTLEAVSLIRKTVAQFMAGIGLHKRNSVPVVFNADVPETMTASKAIFQKMIVLNSVYKVA